MHSGEKTTYADGAKRDSHILNKNLNKILWSAQLNLGIEYHLSDRIFFTLEPYFNYGSNNIDPNRFTSTPASYGGMFSTNYKF